MDNTRKFKATVTSRYGLADKDIYDQLIDLVNKENLSRSRAQVLLVQRGLVHTNNPEPLIKEKVVYKDKPPVEKVVYKEKIVYKDKPDEPKTEHISNELVGGNDKEQRVSDDKLTTPNEANSLLASEVKKSSNNSNVGGWILGLGILGVIVYGLIKS